MCDLLLSPRRSPVRETVAWPDPAAPPYLNAVVVGWSELSAEALLAFAKRLEFLAGRRSTRRFAPRILDIDLLFRAGSRRRRKELELPHPRLAEREFVLGPLAEVAPEIPLPGLGSTAVELLERLRSPRRAPAREPSEGL